MIYETMKSLPWLLPERVTTDPISKVRSQPPTNLIRDLAWEFDLDPIIHLFPEPEKVFPQAMQWVKFRGTLRSLEIALGWLGFPEAQIQFGSTNLTIITKRETSLTEQHRVTLVLLHSLPVREWNTKILFRAE